MTFTKTLYFVSLITMLISCNTKEIDHNSTIEVITEFSELQTIIDSENDKLLVLNFWATTCPPCIKEMPHFKKLESEYSNSNIKILLVSLDRARDLESRVYPFVLKHEIKPEVAILEDQNYSAWTDKIDPSWFGALPATIIIKGKNKKFRFGIYETYQELATDVEEVISR